MVTAEEGLQQRDANVATQMLQWRYWEVHPLCCWCSGSEAALLRRAVTRSSIQTKDQGLGGGREAGGGSPILELKGRCTVVASLPGSLGLSILLRRGGRCQRGGGAGVPLASHKGEDAAKTPKQCSPGIRLKSPKNEQHQGFTLPFLGLLGDDGFGQHVLVELRLQVSRVRVLQERRTLPIYMTSESGAADTFSLTFRPSS